MFVCIVLLFFIFLIRRLLFAILFSPFIFAYGKLAIGKQRNKIDISLQSKAPNEKNSSFFSWLSRIAAGVYRFYIREIGQIPSVKIRLFFYKKVLMMKIGKNVVIYHNADIRAPFIITIDDGSIIGDNVILDGRNGIKIGENVNFSSNVSIWTEQHDHRDPYFRCETQTKSCTVIGNRAWIGPNTIILPNAEVGEGSVVAAGAVVTSKLDAYGLFAGIPAKRIGNRNKDLKYVFTGEYMPFN